VTPRAASTRSISTAAATATAEEDVVAEEGREEVGEVAELRVAGPEAAAAEARVAVPVVELAGLALREDLVRLDDLPEPLVRVGLLRDVGMELACEAAEGPLDLGLARVASDSEQLVVVAVGGGHQAECSVGVRRRGLA
jgi:hypothetical protein